MESEPIRASIAFKTIAEFIVLSSTQLGGFVDLIDDAKWKANVYISGIAKVVDIKSYDFIKHRVKFPEAIRSIYIRFGILNLFNPHRPNGSYRLDLAIYEERCVCKMLLDLAKAEGLTQMTNIFLDGKEIDKLDKEFIDKLPFSGIFEGTYIC